MRREEPLELPGRKSDIPGEVRDPETDLRIPLRNAGLDVLNTYDAAGGADHGLGLSAATRAQTPALLKGLIFGMGWSRVLPWTTRLHLEGCSIRSWKGSRIRLALVASCSADQEVPGPQPLCPFLDAPRDQAVETGLAGSSGVDCRRGGRGRHRYGAALCPGNGPRDSATLRASNCGASLRSIHKAGRLASTARTAATTQTVGITIKPNATTTMKESLPIGRVKHCAQPVANSRSADVDRMIAAFPNDPKSSPAMDTPEVDGKRTFAAV